MARTVHGVWREELCELEDDAAFRAAHKANRAGLSADEWLELASMHVARREVGQRDWADCMDKAVLLCARAMWLVGRHKQFTWWGGSRQHGWRDFLEDDGSYRDTTRLLRNNRVRSAAHTRSAFSPNAQTKNFRYFGPDGAFVDRSLYNLQRFKDAARPSGAGDPSPVHTQMMPLAREPWDLPLRAGDVVVFDLRWHGAEAYSGHVGTIAYFDAEEGALALVEDHLPRKGVDGIKDPSESDAFLFTRERMGFVRVPGYEPVGGPSLFRGVSHWGAGGVFHVPAFSPSGLAFDMQEQRLVRVADRGDDALESPDRYRGRNWAGLVGFARYVCR